jgi:hypothetical protein
LYSLLQNHKEDLSKRKDCSRLQTKKKNLLEKEKWMLNSNPHLLLFHNKDMQSREKCSHISYTKR